MSRLTKRFWEFRAEADVGELLIYGPISEYSWWGDEVTPKAFHDDLKALGDISTLNVYINSPGGDVFAGQTIYSMLKRHSATVNVYVDGLAASAASVIAMAGDTVTIPRNAMLMVHNPWTIALGEARDFRKLADDLDKVGETLVAVYQDKTGLEADEIRSLMDAETWLTADEAVEKGFADKVDAPKFVNASMRGTVVSIQGREFDMGRYKNPPDFDFSKMSFVPRTEQPEKEPTNERREHAPLSIYEHLIALNERKVI